MELKMLPLYNDYLVPFTALLSVLCTISATALGLRIYTRLRITRAFAKDDVILIVSQLINIVSSGVYLWCKTVARRHPRRTQEQYKALSHVSLSRDMKHVTCYIF